MNPVLSLDHVSVRLGATFRLEVEHLDFYTGVLYCLTGPNGAGKTTLLRLLALLSPPERGAILYEGKKVPFHGGAVNAEWRRDITLVQQSPYLFNRCVSDNLAFGLKLRGVALGEQRRRIAEALSEVGLEGFEERPAWELSGGETQRVALARAIVLRPKVLLLDEPLANIDVKHLASFEQLLRSLCREQGITIIMSSHDSGQPARLESPVIALEQGRVADISGAGQTFRPDREIR